MIKAKATLYSKANASCKHLFQIFQLVPLEKKVLNYRIYSQSTQQCFSLVCSCSRMQLYRIVGYLLWIMWLTSAVFAKINWIFGFLNKPVYCNLFVSCQMNFSMTQLLSHTFAHLTGSSFRLKAKLLPIKNILGVKYN